MTTTPPATLASHAASRGEGHRERADHGVARSGDVRDLVAAVDRHEGDGALALEEGHAAAAARQQQVARVEPLQYRATGLLHRGLVGELMPGESLHLRLVRSGRGGALEAGQLVAAVHRDGRLASAGQLEDGL